MALAALFFSLMSLLVRIAGRGLPTMEVVFARSVLVLAISGTFLARARTSPWGTKRKVLLLRGVLGFVALSCFYYALIHLPLADATVIQYTNPVWTALLAALFLSEAIGGRELTLSVVSLGGVVLMTRPTFLFGGDAPALPPGVVGVALIGAVVSGAAYVSVRLLGRTEDPLVVVFWFALVSTIGSIPFLWGRFVIPDPRESLVLAGVGVTTYLGQLFITMGLRDERAGRAMGVAYLQIVFAALWGILALGEYLDRWTLAGASIVLLSTWALGRRW